MIAYGTLLLTWLLTNPEPAAGSSPTPSTSPSASEAKLTVEQLEAPLAGLYMSFRPSVGMALKDAPIEANSTLNNNVNVFPNLPDPKNPGECLNLTGGFDLAIGYDFTDHTSLDIGLELHGGMLVWSGCRSDRVRSLTTLYGTLGPRVGWMLFDRLGVAGFVGGGIHQTDNYVDQDIAKVRMSQGLAIMGGVGVEYFVHMRHFSVGLDAILVAPINPLRISLGLAPHLRYTF